MDRLHADRLLSQADQTTSESDRGRSETDQKLSNTEQAFAEGDQRSSDLDQAAADRIHDDLPHPSWADDAAYELARDERDARSQARKVTRKTRAVIADGRAGSQDQRDRIAGMREEIAEGRDPGGRLIPPQALVR